jgi:magnesium transporter
MLTFYIVENGLFYGVPSDQIAACKDRFIWADLCNPAPEDETCLENLLSIDVPTREEMHDIELSSRLYMKNGILYATATLITKADTLDPETHAITFMIADAYMITIRYCDPKPFRVFIRQTVEPVEEAYRSNEAFSDLFELIVERLAEILELNGHEIDRLTRKIFRWKQPDAEGKLTEKPDFEKMLVDIGLAGDVVSKTRESMVSMNRLGGFILQTPHFKPESYAHNRVKTRLRDIESLSDHASFLSSKLSFLLDATLGMISNEQNATIKIFSVATVVFLPPTLIASIYGMNFQFMPELQWHFGYPLALGLMILSGYLPYRYFKMRKWL